MSNIVFLGNSCVGKSSIINRFVYDLFITENKTTIGCDFYSKILMKNQTEYKLLLWDTSGQDKFRNLTYQYIKKAVVIVIVYDITNINSVNNIYLWIEEAKKNPKANIILVGNKYDIDTSIDLKSIINNIALQFQIDILEYPISSKTGENIDKLEHYIFNKIKHQPRNSNNIILTNEIKTENKCGI